MAKDNNPMLTLRDLEEMVQAEIEKLPTPLNPRDEFAIKHELVRTLVALKQARALEFIANNLRDLTQRNSRIS